LTLKPISPGRGANPSSHRPSTARRARGPLWDGTHDLRFKAFPIRQRGRYDATGNAYSSLYLWEHAQALRNFVIGDQLRSVVDSFARPRIETFIPIDVLTADPRRATRVRSGWREEAAIGPDTDLTTLHARERDRGTSLGNAIFAPVVAIDVRSWRLVRFTLSTDEPAQRERGTLYEVPACVSTGTRRRAGERDLMRESGLRRSLAESAWTLDRLASK
jgi:hypothetical protein